MGGGRDLRGKDGTFGRDEKDKGEEAKCRARARRCVVTARMLDSHEHLLYQIRAKVPAVIHGARRGRTRGESSRTRPTALLYQILAKSGPSVVIGRVRD